MHAAHTINPVQGFILDKKMGVGQKKRMEGAKVGALGDYSCAFPTLELVKHCIHYMKLYILHCDLRSTHAVTSFLRNRMRLGQASV